jgi:hypothetical protein
VAFWINDSVSTCTNINGDKTMRNVAEAQQIPQPTATIIKWPDYETWVAWVTPRRKRLGKPKERGTVIWFPRVHPVYTASRERATRKIKLKGKKS